jgi:ribonuclease Z
VTAFEVYHEPVRPAVGYRFDYKGRSVVVSGDTTKWRNVVANARGADVLVHEAQSQRMRKSLSDAAQAAGNKAVAKIFADIESYHASPVDAAEVANEAGVKLLVFTHFIPPLVSSLLDPLFFDGVAELRPQAGWVIGFDGLRLDLPANSNAIIQGKIPLGLLR